MVGLSVNDGFEEGIMMADEMNRILGDDGKVGYVFYDDVYYICNMIDTSFIDALESRHPTMEVVEKSGWVAEDEAQAVAAAIIQKHPDVEGLFTTYMVPAMYMVGACQEAGRDDIAVVTFGIDMPVLLNLIEGGNVKSLTTDMPYYLGFNAAMLGAYGLLDKEVPGSGYVVMPNMAITVDNVRDVWDLAMNIPFPEELEEALQKIGK
jgi:ribose transport system substrate-binding protein